MLLSLTTQQLLDLAPGTPLALLAEILGDVAPGATGEIRCPSQARAHFGRALRALQEAGLLHVEDPGSWSRTAYQVRPIPSDLASWIARSGALRHWPSLYPQAVEALRAQYQDLDDSTFRDRLQAGICSALDAERRPPNIIPWLQVALTRPAPARPAADRSEPLPEPDQTPIPRSVASRLLNDRGYTDLAYYRDGDR